MPAKRHYTACPEFDRQFPEGAYRVRGWDGIAWRALGFETAPDEDTEWSGIEEPTGKVVCHMVGDDRLFSFEPGALSPLSDEEFCAECGQIGCGHSLR